MPQQQQQPIDIELIKKMLGERDIIIKLQEDMIMKLQSQIQNTAKPQNVKDFKKT